MTDLDRRVALALGGLSNWNGGWAINGEFYDELPGFSTDQGNIGPLLLEAAKRGWQPSVEWTVNHDGIESWCASCRANATDFHVWSPSLPEAVCLAFCAASEGKACAK